MTAEERTAAGRSRLHAGDGAAALRSLPTGNRAEARLLNRVRRLEQENSQLREALASRIVIEQAKGVLAERHRRGLDEAFELLRHTARSNRVRIHTLAAAVIAARRVPGALDVDGQMLRCGALLAHARDRGVPGEVA